MDGFGNGCAGVKGRADGIKIRIIKADLNGVAFIQRRAEFQKDILNRAEFKFEIIRLSGLQNVRLAGQAKQINLKTVDCDGPFRQIVHRSARVSVVGVYIKKIINVRGFIFIERLPKLAIRPRHTPQKTAVLVVIDIPFAVGVQAVRNVRGLR